MPSSISIVPSHPLRIDPPCVPWHEPAVPVVALVCHPWFLGFPCMRRQRVVVDTHQYEILIKYRDLNTKHPIHTTHQSAPQLAPTHAPHAHSHTSSRITS